MAVEVERDGSAMTELSWLCNLKVVFSLDRNKEERDNSFAVEDEFLYVFRGYYI